MNPSLDISIIVACRNEMRSIREFLNSVAEQDMGRWTWEALIADGISDDGTREILDTFSSQHRNIRILTNRGRLVSTGLNAAIIEARGRIIMRLDAHTHYASDYCQRCVETLERTGAANVGGPARTRSEGAQARAIAAAYHSPFSTGGARFHQPDFEGFVDTVPYGCWRRETFDQIGLFDETLVRNQDDEFNLRLLRAGGKIWQSPAIVSWYSPRATIRALFLQYFQYGYWKVAVIQKHRLPGSWRHLVPAGFVLASILPPLIVAAAAIARTRLIFDWACLTWLIFVGLYAVGNVTASAMAARRSGIETLVYLPAVFAAFHFSYGLGFLVGIRHFVPQTPAKIPSNSIFARITH
jgi:succinoglycan biosynthesis protein ExoA